jgi:hypothetical protein
LLALLQALVLAWGEGGGDNTAAGLFEGGRHDWPCSSWCGSAACLLLMLALLQALVLV